MSVPQDWVVASAGRAYWSVVGSPLDPALAGLVAPPVVVRAAPLTALEGRRVAPAPPRAARRRRATRAG